MVSGAELTSVWSILLAGSAFVIFRTTYLLSSHCQGPVFLAPDWALWGLLLLMASVFILAVIPSVSCGQAVVSHSHIWDKCCGFLFSLPLRRDFVSVIVPFMQMGMEFDLHVEIVLSVYTFKQNPAAIAALWKQFVNIIKKMQSLDSPPAYSQFLNHLGLTGPRLQPDATFLYILPDSAVDCTHWL